ncbi:AAA family ATPase [Methylosinus sp. PW1]|uniref:AAA family ATPase n=1 Tax=Methylosinus sp. PW1 TaxID=107636 RepID=UPI00055BCFCC|nr:AAA family ATPase [Methylosinus sp. PW1]
MVKQPNVSLTAQISNIRWAAPTRGAIVVAMRTDVTGAESWGSYLIRIPAKTLGKQGVFEGDVWKFEGLSEQYRGRPQLRAVTATLVRPYGRNMVATLSSARFPGIGKTKAAALWERFGDDLRGLLDREDVDKLSEVVTIDAATVLVEGWRTFQLGDVVEWLDKHRLPVKLGTALLDFYGARAIQKVEADPYRLLAFGLGWRSVDEIATGNFGISPDDPRREHAAVAEVLYRAYDRDGSTALEHDSIVARTRTILAGSEEQAFRAVGNPYAGGGWLRDEDSGLYQSSGAWLLEQYVAARIRRMIDGQDDPAQNDLLLSSEFGPSERQKARQALADWQAAQHPLGEEQERAVWTALENRIAVVSGVAGAGKTASLTALYAALDAIGSEVVQMALAGRAAKRMHEATGRKAITIAGFLHQDSEETDRLDTRTYVVDEASMVDVATLFGILRKLGPGARLVLVGDPAQLPPIGAGLTFHLLCRPDSPAPRAHLTRVYRQDGATGIPAIAGAIRSGNWPAIPAYSGPAVGVSILPCSRDDLATIADVYDALVTAEGDEAEVQILGTTHAEVGSLNEDLYDRRLSERRAVRLDDREYSGFCEGCPIIFRENDWERGLNNGSLGTIIRSIDPPMFLANAGEQGQQGALLRLSEAMDEDGAPRFTGDVVHAEAVLDGNSHYLTQVDLVDRVQRAYGLTVHKAQGSQWSRVIVVVGKSQLLDRTLVYTALTRGVRQVVLVGDIEAAQQAVAAEPRVFDRVTNLANLLTANNHANI